MHAPSDRKPARHAPAVAILLLASLAAPVTAQVRFEVEYSTDATTATLTSAEKNYIATFVSEAGRRWLQYIPVQGARTITVRVTLDNSPTANSASAYGAPIGNMDGHDLLEQAVAYELLTGNDLNGDDPDAVLNIGANYLRNELWFDPDPTTRLAPMPQNRTDALSVMLHEFGHMLAYNGWADGHGNQDIVHWSTFDAWIIPGDPAVFAGPAADVAWNGQPDLTTNNTYHWGNPPATTTPRTAGSEHCIAGNPAWSAGNPVPRRCDAPYSRDRRVQTDAALQGGGPGDQEHELMFGLYFLRGTRYDITTLDQGVLQDIGLRLDTIFDNGFEG